MLYPWAVPGRKVVCINAKERTGPQPKPGYVYAPGASLDGLEEGRQYTILSVEISPYTDSVTVQLHEIIRPAHNGLLVGYWAGRFRPLRTQEESVALFAHHLTQAPVSRTVETHNMEPIPNDA